MKLKELLREKKMLEEEPGVTYCCSKCHQEKEYCKEYWNFQVSPDLNITICNGCYDDLVKTIETWLKEPAK